MTHTQNTEFKYDPSKPLLILGAQIYSTDDPFAEALLIEDGVVAWVGADSSANSIFDETVTRLELQGNLVTPSFWELAGDTGVFQAGKAGQTGDACAKMLKQGIVQSYSRNSIPADFALLEVDPALNTDFRATATSGLPYVLSGTKAKLSPWEVIREAAYLAPVMKRMSARAAFLAMTRSPRRLLGQAHPGALNPGVAASLVIWQSWPLIVKGNDEVIQTWSTDPRSRTPLLPELDPNAVDNQVPQAEYVFEQGKLVYENGVVAIEEHG